MYTEMTVQIRVLNFTKGLEWYKTLLKKEPDFVPHDGFAEWEVVKGSWLQLVEGTPSERSGPIRFAIENIEAERERLMQDLDVERFEISSREGVPVKWGTFTDPWGNCLGFFEYIKKEA